MQAATRMADGQWPWRDFGWAYGPGEPLFVMVATRSSALAAVVAVPARRLGRDGRGARSGRSCAECRPGLGDLGVGGGRGHRRAADQRQPDRARARVRARLGLPGDAAAVRVGRARPRRGAAFFRPDVGVLAAIAAAVTLVMARAGPGPRRAGAASWQRSGAIAVRRHGARTVGGRLGARARASSPRRAARASGNPRPARARSRACSWPRWADLVLYLPFVVAAGPGTVWDALVVQASRDGSWWRLPFPPGFDGGDVKDFADVAGALRRVHHARARDVAGSGGSPACSSSALGALVYYRLARGPRACAGAADRRAGLAALIRPEARRRGRARAADRGRRRRTAPRRCSSRPTSRRWRRPRPAR